MTVCSIQQCLTGTRRLKRVGATLRTWHAPSSPSHVTDPDTCAKVNQVVQCDCHVTLQRTSEHLGFGVECMNHIITQVLGCWKVSAVWVLKSWIEEQKATHMGICLECLLQYERKGDKFLDQIVVEDEFWCLHFDPETKHMSQHWKHPSSFWLTKNHTIPSAGKVMLTLYFNRCGLCWLTGYSRVSLSVPAAMVKTWSI
jgi:hypothetical protein